MADLLACEIQAYKRSGYMKESSQNVLNLVNRLIVIQPPGLPWITLIHLKSELQ